MSICDIDDAILAHQVWTRRFQGAKTSLSLSDFDEKIVGSQLPATSANAVGGGLLWLSPFN